MCTALGQVMGLCNPTPWVARAQGMRWTQSPPRQVGEFRDRLVNFGADAVGPGDVPEQVGGLLAGGACSVVDEGPHKGHSRLLTWLGRASGRGLCRPAW